MEVGVVVRWRQPEVNAEPFLHFACARHCGTERRGRQLAAVPREGWGCVCLWGGFRRCQSTSALLAPLPLQRGELHEWLLRMRREWLDAALSPTLCGLQLGCNSVG